MVITLSSLIAYNLYTQRTSPCSAAAAQPHDSMLHLASSPPTRLTICTQVLDEV